MSDITRYRGDTRRIRRTVEQDGAAIDISGWSFKLTISREQDPSDTLEQVAQISGAITDGPNGVVDFVPDVADVDEVGTFYFDIESIDDGGGVSTLDKGQFILLQDITKSDEEFIWTPDSSLADDSVIPTDASEFWWQATYNASDVWTKQTRDTIAVMRWAMALTESTSQMRELHPFGPDCPRPRAGFGLGWEFEILAYCNLTVVELLLLSPGWWDHLDFALNNSAGGDPTAYIGSRIEADFDYPSGPDTTGWGADWFRMACRIDATGAQAVRAWVEGGSEGSRIVVNSGNTWNPRVPFGVSIGARYVNPDDPAARCDLAEFIWRRLS